jgi:hypothetical protein
METKSEEFEITLDSCSYDESAESTATNTETESGEFEEVTQDESSGEFDTEDTLDNCSDIKENTNYVTFSE